MAKKVPSKRPISAKESHLCLAFTNTGKVFWPKEKYTKGDVIAYYEKIAAVMLPYLKDRPQNLNRHPSGTQGKNFYQKNFRLKAPVFVHTKDVWAQSDQKKLRYLLCQNKETLLYLANLGCIEINPWSSRLQNLDRPDYLVIDLDPDGNSYDEVVLVARQVHSVLIKAGITSYPKTSGKTGMHICVPLGAQYSYKQAREFAELIARMVNAGLPRITSIERNPKKRRGKIYIDFLQNGPGQTIAAPYSLRPYPGATVSTPLEWKEVQGGLNPRDFTIKTIFKRLKKKGDLWKPVLGRGINLKAAVRRLEHEFR